MPLWSHNVAKLPRTLQHHNIFLKKPTNGANAEPFGTAS